MPKKQNDELFDKLNKGFELVYERLIEYKKYKKSPLVVKRNDDIAYVSPHDMPPKLKKKEN